MNYMYRKESENTYMIVESQTNYVIWNNLNQEEARSKTRQLNWGSGFDGFTPGFILERIVI